jgi:hypothetical protein
MAPEVVKCPLKAHPDDNKMDTRFHYNAVVDTWAVGCMAYELIAGTPPFMAETQQEVVNNINHKQVRVVGCGVRVRVYGLGGGHLHPPQAGAGSWGGGLGFRD